MNILDIDLDFFLNNRAIGDSIAPKGRRLPFLKYRRWGRKEVKSFFENNCGLIPNRQIPLFVIKDHHYVLRIALEKGFNDINLYHVDAHHDLYCTKSPWFYNQYTNQQVEVREKMALSMGMEYVNEGNYIGFLLACEKLSSVKYITNFKYGWQKDRPCRMFCKNFDENGSFLQIPRSKKNYCFEKLDNPYDKIDHIEFIGKSVPFDVIDSAHFTCKSMLFDCAFLSCSPEYTPRSSDKLIPIIKSYFNTIITNYE